MKMCLGLIVMFCVCVAHAQDRGSFNFEGEQRSFVHYEPRNVSTPAPAIILLHGSGGSSDRLLRYWLPIAEREQLILVAPDAADRNFWQRKTEPSAFFRDLIDQVDAHHPVQRDRVYIFGHSGGAVYALTLAMLQSQLFAAVAVHAGAWRTKEELQIHRLALRKIPVAIIVGSRDPFFSLRDVHRTHQTLEAAGHLTLLNVIQRHDHDYSDVVDHANEWAWKFMRAHALPDRPRFIVYE